MGRTESTVASARPPPRWLIFPRCPQDAESGRQVVSSGRLFLWSWSSGGQGGEAEAGSRGEAGWGGGAGGQGGQAEQGGRGWEGDRMETGGEGRGRQDRQAGGGDRGTGTGSGTGTGRRPAAGGRPAAGRSLPRPPTCGGQRLPAVAVRGGRRSGSRCDRCLLLVVERRDSVHTASFVPIFNSGLYGRACFYPSPAQKRKGALSFWWGTG